MKKRYLSMLMAVVMCLSFGITGALAAEEPAIETAEVSTESAAPASEQPVESAAPSETPTAVETAADVPTPMSVQAGAVALDGVSRGCNGVAIAGYGGTVVTPFSSVSPTLSWTSSTPEGVTVNLNEENIGEGIRTLILTVDSNTTAGDYSFQVGSDQNGTLNVLSLENAIGAGNVSSEGFDLTLWGTPAPDASPEPLSGAKFGLYTADPSGDETATPVTTFTTDDGGKVTIKLDLTTVAEEALPPIGDPTASEGEKGGKTYYLQQISTPDGWYYPTTVTEVWGYAQWVTDSTNYNATTQLKVVLQKPGDPNENNFSVKNYRLIYDGFDLYAWTAGDVTWDGTDLSYTEEKLSGAEFTVYEYENDTKGSKVATFTTGTDGKVTIDPKKLCPSLPAGESKEFYLVQTKTPADPVHGDRPLPKEGWAFSASAVLSNDGKEITVKLDTPEQKNEGWVDDNGDFWVYNDRWASVCLDVEKTVAVKNEGDDPGENTFDFVFVYGFWGENNLAAYFTPEGGERGPVDIGILDQHEDDDEGSTYYELAANFSMTVQGTGTAKGTVTIEGWESQMADMGSADVCELGDDTDNWKLADCTYNALLRYTPDVRGVELVGPEFALGRLKQLDEAPAGGENTGKGSVLWVDNTTFTAYRGYNGRWYGVDEEQAETARFVNTYTKTLSAAAEATTKNSPKTGDEASVMLWLALAAVSAMGIAIVARKKAK